MFDRILVLCTGNICRSPIAEGVLRERLRDQVVESAGTAALIGEPADPLSVAVAADHGLDISTHRARQATAPLLYSFDLILVLDQGHIDWLTRQYPELRGRAHKLLRWHHNADVADPYGQSRAAFDEAWDDIVRGVEAWQGRVARRAKNVHPL